jgi:hypothetical protein
MAISITRRLKPEEEEVLRKKEELNAIHALLADRELEFAELRAELAAFEGRYLRQVGALYAELDDWHARRSTLEAELNPSRAAEETARHAQEKARATREAAHGEASRATEFSASLELKRLFREAAKRMHPDLACDDADRKRRTKFMAEANRAYRAADAETIQRILDEFSDDLESSVGPGIGAELVRIIRQISQVRQRVSALERQTEELNQSEIGRLKRDADEARLTGRDLLAELETRVRGQIQKVRTEYDSLTRKD